MNVFLGYPPENIKQWIINNRPTPPSASGPLCFEALEDEGASIALGYWDEYMYGQRSFILLKARI